MKPKVRFYWEEQIDPELIRQAAVAAYGMEDDKEKWHKLWNWRFENCHLSDRIYAAYVLEHNTVACFYAISPLTILRDDGSTLKAGLAIWGFTHPDYQGRGYYSEMYQQTQRTMADLGFDCLLAFDNHNSHYPEVKYLGWGDIGVLNNFSLACTSVKPPSTKADDAAIMDHELDAGFLQRISTFQTTTARHHIQRSFDYLKWRLLENPVNTYRARSLYRGGELLASVIYKHYLETELDIMEMFQGDLLESEVDKYLHRLIYDLAITEARQINLWSRLQSPEHLLLEKIGFQERCFSTYFVCNPMHMDKDILDIRNWHYRYLDSDVY